ncbi:unnamed protein product [Musa acuminata subsp. malaccensis]|uniref:DELLA protein n=1 Tax=Musa acuminata subsp. malaccensis TaxID=214687 RepID=A0A804JPF5_MUSAM|nr:PREDICTED: DELLA protein GAI-like [Musa acuminata subsp. malaccensis]CAG1848467.1 unnamed protein product [Musa acuminata subsp. malaccensis]
MSSSFRSDMGTDPYDSVGDDRWIIASASDRGSSRGEIDSLLHGAGYRVRSTDLRHVAIGLEQLESTMVGDQCVASSAEAIHYNPSDLTAWVDSMLSELAPDPHLLRHPLSTAAANTWADPTQQRPSLHRLENHHQHRNVPAVSLQSMDEEEDAAIRLVHLLVSCADSVQRGDSEMAGSLLDQTRLALARVNTGFGIGKVAGYFVDALCRRLYPPPPSATGGGGSAANLEILYHHFYEACPYIKFAHFTANQAILEAFQGHDRVHVVDFNLMHGLQWPALIQALALRPGGPPLLRLTGIGAPSPDGRDALREVGLRLAELARSVQVRFAFRGVAATRLEHVRPWMFQVAPGEAVAVNTVLQLHRLLGDRASPEGGDAAAAEPIDTVLEWIVGLKPKIVTVVEQEADHNKPSFLDRFTEALFYYSTMFDSLEGGRVGGSHRGGQQQQQTVVAAVAEAYLQREMCNIVCCEGAARVERHEPLARWRDRLGRAGLRAVHLGSNAFKQASMLLTLFSGEGYCVEEVAGCLTLGWHSRPLISASAWRADDADDASPPRDHQTLVLQDHSSSITSGSNNVVDGDDHLHQHSVMRSHMGSSDRINDTGSGSSCSRV